MAIIPVLTLDKLSPSSLVCSDGILSCHRLVLAAQSAFLRRLMEKEEDSLLLLPDVSVDHMATVLKFLYTGTLFVTKTEVKVIR